MLLSKIRFTFLAIVAALIAYAQKEPTLPPYSMANEWSFDRDEKDRLYMVRMWHYDASKKRLVFIIGEGKISPHKGINKYDNGRSRDMTDEEIDYYWECSGAKYALAKYICNNKKCESIMINSDTIIPDRFFNNPVVLLTKNKHQFIGRLLLKNNSKNEFALRIEKSQEPILFHVSAIESLTLLKLE